MDGGTVYVEVLKYALTPALGQMKAAALEVIKRLRLAADGAVFSGFGNAATTVRGRLS